MLENEASIRRLEDACARLEEKAATAERRAEEKVKRGAPLYGDVVQVLNSMHVFDIRCPNALHRVAAGITACFTRMTFVLKRFRKPARAAVLRQLRSRPSIALH